MGKNETSKIVNVFWTGGWDSTYMVLCLVRAGYMVQPIYVVSYVRHSADREQTAIETMTNLINSHGLTGYVLPVKKYQRDQIAPNEEITRAYQQIKKQFFLGTQYEYLARLLWEHRTEFPIVGLGVEEINNRAQVGFDAVINASGVLDTSGEFARLDRQRSQSTVTTLFGNYIFPIIDKSEVTMAEEVKAWGDEEIMKHIWFCHYPLQDEPCGICHPCEQKMTSHMEWLLPETAQKRYAQSRWWKKLLGSKVYYKLTPLYSKLATR